MIIAGVDEAGRGPVIGPMVMAICAIPEEEEYKLKQMGVKDSKLLSPKQRNSMFEEIKKLCVHGIIILKAKDIDSALNNPSTNLNLLEAETSTKLTNAIKCDKVILDCPSTNISAYTNFVKAKIRKKDVKVIAEHKADLNHVIVGAASILAKVTRDREIEKIKKEIRVDFGSGYPSDPRTVAFLKDNWNKYDIFRKTWSTYKKLAEAKAQKGLGEF